MKVAAVIFISALIIFAAEIWPFALDNWFQVHLNIVPYVFVVVELGSMVLSFYLLKKVSPILKSSLSSLAVGILVLVLTLSLTLIFIG